MIKEPNKRSLIVGGILVLIVVADLFIFKLITGKPLGLEPSNLDSAPKIHTSTDAVPVIDLKIPVGIPYVLVPALSFEVTETGKSPDFDILGFGQIANSLYLHLRLYESQSLSLKKGWGKAFQLIDNSNRHYLYDSYSLPSAVQIHDALPDLPDDLRAEQTVIDGGFRDLYLHYPEFPAKAVPVQLRVIEAFQGNSPANPGHIFADIPLVKTGEIQKREAVTALGSLDKKLRVTSPLQVQEKITVSPQRFWLDENLLPHLSLDVIVSADTGTVISDTVLIDESGANYNHLSVEEKVIIAANQGQPASVEFLYERLPDTANIQKAWVKFIINETEYGISIEL